MGSGCARRSPSPPPLTHGSGVPWYFRHRIIPGGISPPEPADTPRSLPWTWWVGPSTLPTRGNAPFFSFLLTSGCSWFQRREGEIPLWASEHLGITQPNPLSCILQRAQGPCWDTRPCVMPVMTSGASLAFGLRQTPPRGSGVCDAGDQH